MYFCSTISFSYSFSCIISCSSISNNYKVFICIFFENYSFFFYFYELIFTSTTNWTYLRWLSTFKYYSTNKTFPFFICRVGSRIYFCKTFLIRYFFFSSDSTAVSIPKILYPKFLPNSKAVSNSFSEGLNLILRPGDTLSLNCFNLSSIFFTASPLQP